MKRLYLPMAFLLFSYLSTFLVADINPVAWWKFDDASGSIAEDFINDADGSLVNGPVWTTGLIDGALSFDGMDDYIVVGGYKGITGSASRTCTAWIKTAEPSGEIITWGSEDGAGARWIVRINEGGQLRVEVQSGNIIGTTVINDNTWHHIAVVLNNDGSPNINEVQLYVDGQLEIISTSVEQLVNTGSVQDVQIGVYTVSQRYFNGIIDDVRVYDTALSEEDIVGSLREFFRSEVWVDDDYSSDGENDGHTWGYDAFDTIQDGIDVTLNGIVNVAAGTYVENIILKNSVKVVGSDPDVTIIDGNQNGSVVVANSCGSGTKLSGLSFCGGSVAHGGAISIYNSNLTINNCIFRNNFASMSGGGIYSKQSNLTLVNCKFISNTSFEYGGAIYNIGNNNTIFINCQFFGNYALSTGGAISNLGCNVIISGCLLVGNSVTYRGGAINNLGSHLRVTNSTFYGNTTSQEGSAIYNSYYNSVDPVLLIENCIMRNNTGDEVIYTTSYMPDPFIAFSNIQQSNGSGADWASSFGIDGGGNIDINPLFVDRDGADNIIGTEDDDFRLASNSPCIDAGHNGYFVMDVPDLDNDGLSNEAVPLDADGNIRYMDVINIVDSGVSFVSDMPVIDMGAYEHPGRVAIEGDINHDRVVNLLDLSILAEHWLDGAE